VGVVDPSGKGEHGTGVVVLVAGECDRGDEGTENGGPVLAGDDAVGRPILEDVPETEEG